MISNINICCCDTRLLLLLLIMIFFTFVIICFTCFDLWIFFLAVVDLKSLQMFLSEALWTVWVSVWIKFDWSVTVTLTQFHNHVMFLGARFSESFFHHWNTETGTNQNHGSEPRAVSAVKIRVSIKNDVSLLKKSSSSTLSARWPSQWLDCFKLFVFVWRRAAGRTTAEQTASCRPLWPQSTFIYTFQQYVSRMCARRLEAQNRPPAVILC